MNQIAKQAPSVFSKWYRGHLRAMREGLILPFHAPLASLLTVITLAICFYLPLVMWSLWQNFSALESQWQGQGSVAIFLRSGVEAPEVQALQQELNDRALIAEVVIVENETVKDNLNQDPQLKQIIDVIKSHELPDQILIKPNPNATSDQLQSLAQKLQLNPDIEYVSFDANWFNQLKALTQSFYYLMQASIVVFLVIIFVFLSNSIAGEIAAHKSEIGLKKLLGASAAQIRRRFLYGGVYYGVLAALLAVLLLQLTLFWLQLPIQELSQSFGYDIVIKSPSLTDLLVFLIIVVAVVWLGSRISAANHIRQLA